MRLVIVSLAVILAVSFADSTWEGHTEGVHIPLPPTDDIIDTNAYDEEHVFSTAFAIFTNFWVADDFTPDYMADIEILTIWTVTTTTNPAAIEVFFYNDVAPGPGVVLWTQLTTDITWTDSGVTFAGYTIYICEMSLPNADYFTVNGGTTYWVTAHRSDGQNLYSIHDDEVEGTECYRDIGSGWVPGSTTGYAATDMFRIIEGTIALDRNTWGGLKTLF